MKKRDLRIRVRGRDVANCPRYWSRPHIHRDRSRFTAAYGRQPFTLISEVSAAGTGEMRSIIMALGFSSASVAVLSPRSGLRYSSFLRRGLKHLLDG